MSTDTIYLLAPEAILACVALLIYVGGTVFRASAGWTGIALVGVVAAGAALAQQYGALFWPGGDTTAPILAASVGGPLSADLFAQYARWLTLVVGGLFLLISASSAKDSQPAEFCGTLLMAMAGLMLAAAARDLSLVFLGLELVSIPTYILLYLGRKDVASQESATKYFFLSILSSALLLYGFSFLYGIGGSTSLTSIRATLAAAPAGEAWTLLARIAALFIFAGLGFRLTAVPFHFYAPDVYQGTTNANAGLLAILPKIAGLVALVRVLAVAMPGVEGFAWRLALVISILSMSLGNVVALWQTNIRRMMAYSSVAHAGYMLIGLAVAFADDTSRQTVTGLDGVGAAIFYLAVYALAATGAFAVLAYLGGEGREIDTFDDLAGAGRTNPVAGVLMAVFMFSLAGIPPLAGFWGKLSLAFGTLGVGAAPGSNQSLRPWFVALAIILALNAAVAAAYYLRVISVMYFRSAAAPPPAKGGLGAILAASLSAVAVVGLGLEPGAVERAAQAASRSARVEPGAAPVIAERSSRPEVALARSESGR